MNPADCLVFEDAPKGVEAARTCRNALRGSNDHAYTEMNFPATDHIVAFIKDYTDPFIRHYSESVLFRKNSPKSGIKSRPCQFAKHSYSDYPDIGMGIEFSGQTYQHDTGFVNSFS